MVDGGLWTEDKSRAIASVIPSLFGRLLTRTAKRRHIGSVNEQAVLRSQPHQLGSRTVIVVTILYPRSPAARFDFDYYLGTHMKRSAALLGPRMHALSVERGIDPGAPWPPPTYFAICRFVCESRETYESAFLPHAEELQGDAANYTNVTPVIQVSEYFPLTVGSAAE